MKKSIGSADRPIRIGAGVVIGILIVTGATSVIAPIVLTTALLATRLP